MRIAPALCLAALACSSPPAAPPAPSPAARLDADGGPARSPAAAPGAPALAFPPEVRSLRLRRSTVVKLEPDGAAKNLGAVAADTRVEYGVGQSGPGCKLRWIAIAPRGWLCEEFVEPSAEAPVGVELPRLGRGERIPGTYGKVTAASARILTLADGKVVKQRAVAGSTMVRKVAEKAIGGAPHWQISKDELIAARAITVLEPADYHGVRLGDETGLELPLAFAVAKKHVLDRVPVWSTPAATERVRTLAPRAIVTIVARDPSGALSIGEGEWLRGEDVREVEAARPPPGLQAGERWIDVDLDRQTLVAYDGDRPAYATLVSTGRSKNPTDTGLYRVWLKFAETDMNGQMGDEPAYSVATVPWTQFYAKDLALHTAYWHDRFGTPRSHGCVNLSPTDARFLYFWSLPDVPPGWSMAHGIVERPGSLIRVRSAADPDPVPKGYAARVAELTSPPAGGGTVER